MLILSGSARPHGDTGRAVALLREKLPPEPEVIDLAAAGIRPFDYALPRQRDGLDAVAARMLAHDEIVFATPVYWYAMSGATKTLLDRFSDLLGDRDPERRGRRLAGRGVWLLAVGTDPDMPGGFDVPFARTADYLGMHWRGGVYLSTGRPAAWEEALRRFAERIEASASASA